MSAAVVSIIKSPAEEFKRYFKYLPDEQKVNIAGELVLFIGEEIEPILAKKAEKVTEEKEAIACLPCKILMPANWSYPRFYFGQAVGWEESYPGVGEGSGKGRISGMDYIPDCGWFYSIDIEKSLADQEECQCLAEEDLYLL